MGSGSYKQVHVQCPFYRFDNNRKICCEGIVDGSIVSQTYRTHEDKDQQMNIFCCEYFKNCEVYRMIMEAKY